MRTTKTKTSLPELMAAASEVAFACSDNAHEAYRMTQQALIEFVRNLNRAGDAGFAERSDSPLIASSRVH